MSNPNTSTDEDVSESEGETVFGAGGTDDSGDGETEIIDIAHESALTTTDGTGDDAESSSEAAEATAEHAEPTDTDASDAVTEVTADTAKDLVRRSDEFDAEETSLLLGRLDAEDADVATITTEIVRRDPELEDVSADFEGLQDLLDDEHTEDELEIWVESQDTPEPDDVRENVLAEVREYYETVSLDESFADRPTDEFIETRWFDFSYLDDVVHIERRWVNRPYAYVSILFDRRAKEFRYHVTEVTQDGFETYVREDMTRILRNSLMYQDIDTGADRETVFEQRAKEEIAEHAATVEDGSIYKLLYYLLRDFLDYGKIDPLMRDPNLEDISCDGSNVPIFVYHSGYRDLRTNVTFGPDELASFTVRLAQRAGKHISVSDPLVDASLPDGSRIQLTLGGEIATRGSNFTVRKFADVPYTPVDLIKWNTFDVDQMAYFWLAIENNKSLIFAGGTGSGKTTSMNAIGFFIPPNSKVVSIEDTRELTLPHDNWIQSVTREGVTAGGRGEVSMYKLLQASLRQRPEYLLVGEIRTEQNVGLTFFNAIATGHTSYTTVHADSVQGALGRLQNPPLSIPEQLIQDLDVIAIQKQIFQDDQRVRRNQAIAEILPTEDFSAVEHQTVFEWDPLDDVYEQQNDSHLLAEIADERGWTPEEIQQELAERRTVLQTLVDADITDYDDVTKVIHDFNKDRDAVLDAIETDALDAYLTAGER